MFRYPESSSVRRCRNHGEGQHLFEPLALVHYHCYRCEETFYGTRSRCPTCQGQFVAVSSPAHAQTVTSASGPATSTTFGRLQETLVELRFLTALLEVHRQSLRNALQESLNDGQSAANPAPPHAYQALQEHPMSCKDQEHSPSCVVCMEEWKEGDMALQLPCGHDFHRPCVKRWLDWRNSCPICRSKLEPTAEDLKQRRLEAEAKEAKLQETSDEAGGMAVLELGARPMFPQGQHHHHHHHPMGNMAMIQSGHLNTTAAITAVDGTDGAATPFPRRLRIVIARTHHMPR